MGIDPDLAGKLEHSRTCDSGQDSSVGWRRAECFRVHAEDIRPGRLQRGVLVKDQGQTFVRRLRFEQRAVSPLVRSKSSRDLEAVKRGRFGSLLNLTERGPRIEPTVPRHDVDPHGAVLRLHIHLIEIRHRKAREELIEAACQAPEMRLQLDWAAVYDEQGLEDALAGVGHVAIVATSDGLKTLLIDNYDSFTYNLFQLLGEVNGEEPLVVRNDEGSWEELAGLEFENVVISPGPGRPDREDDFGVCAAAIRDSTRPLLGVCLGHQGLGALYGAAIVPAPEPVHGRAGAVLHDDSPLFAGIPREFQAVRYHSLCVEQPLPPELRGIAWTSDGVLMAVEHCDRPLWGVQFHPESICTEHGRRLVSNFRELSARWR